MTQQKDCTDVLWTPGHCYVRTLLQLWNTAITLFSNCCMNNTDCRDLTNDNGAESFLTSWRPSASQEIPAFYGTRKVNTAVTRARTTIWCIYTWITSGLPMQFQAHRKQAPTINFRWRNCKSTTQLRRAINQQMTTEYEMGSRTSDLLV
jgi:hypothetical protein